MAKRKADDADSGDVLEIMPLGAGNEVGRSCILLKFKGKTVMLDCGIHPAYTGLSGLPFFDEIDDPSTIDLLLVSHFHLDHCGALPYFLEKTTFKGRVYMTHPSKAIYKMLLTDYVKVSNTAVDEKIYDEQDISNTMEKIETINYHQELEHNGIKFWCYNAGHVLGAAMFMLEIAGVKILYTGDFSREEDRHLMSAETPVVAPDILIVESTYGVQTHEPRLERELLFTSLIHDIVRRGGRCLIPVFALGRAQELLLILEEYWDSHTELQSVPIYYASALAKKCMTVFRTYIDMMNEKIRNQFAISNPFIFKHISNLKSMDHFDDIGSSVVMASPGMLQNGLSRQLFELWCPDEKNGIVIPGYCVDGTLAKHILSNPRDIPTMQGPIVPLKMSVHYISFSAHSDYKQTSEFINILKPPNIVLVHGDSNEMSRLKQALVETHPTIQVLTPKNCQPVQLRFRAEKIVKTVGSLAAEAPKDRKKISGVLVQKDFNHHLMSANDLHIFTQLATSSIIQRLMIPFDLSWTLLSNQLSLIFDDISEGEPTADNKQPTLKIGQQINISRGEQGGQTVAVLEWLSNPVNDMVIDSIISLLLQLKTNPAAFKWMYPAVKMEEGKVEEKMSQPLSEEDKKENERSIVTKFLSGFFGQQNVTLLTSTKEESKDIDPSSSPSSSSPSLLSPLIEVKVDLSRALISLNDWKVDTSDDILRGRLEQIIKRIQISSFPLAL